MSRARAMVIVAGVAFSMLLWWFSNAPDDDGSASASTDGTELAEQVRALPGTTPDRQAQLAASYDRDTQFGGDWLDPDGNSCTAREDVLLRDRDGGHPRGCRVVGLVIQDPYTGTVLHGTRAVQIDHIIPLSAAWQSGADRWTSDQRRAFANDPRNLLAVDARTNMSKGDQAPDEWMPPNRGAWCDYVTRYVQVATAYRLAVTNATRGALLRHATNC